MSLVDKFLDGIKLVDEDEYYEEEYEEYEEEEEEGRKGFLGIFKRRKKDDVEEEVEEAPASSKLTPMMGGKSSKKRQVCVIKPSSFDDVKEIADTLLSNATIILNMEGIDLALAQRIIDFMMGSCYAIDGNLQKITNYIFIITPSAVEIFGDFQGLVDAFEESRMASGGGYATF